MKEDVPFARDVFFCHPFQKAPWHFTGQILHSIIAPYSLCHIFCRSFPVLIILRFRKLLVLLVFLFHPISRTFSMCELINSSNCSSDNPCCIMSIIVFASPSWNSSKRSRIPSALSASISQFHHNTAASLCWLRSFETLPFYFLPNTFSIAKYNILYVFVYFTFSQILLD